MQPRRASGTLRIGLYVWLAGSERLRLTHLHLPISQMSAATRLIALNPQRFTEYA